MNIQRFAEERVFPIGGGVAALASPEPIRPTAFRAPGKSRQTPAAARLPLAGDPGVICFGPYMLFPAQQMLLKGDETVRLGSRALGILVVLVGRAGEIVTKDELVAAVWPGLHIDDSNLRVHVAALRRALGDDAGQCRYIKTVPLRGYCFVARVTKDAPTDPDAALAVAAIRPSPAPPAAANSFSPSLSQQLADHASLLNGLIVAEGGVDVTAREAALISLQILALDAALTQVLQRKG